MKTRKIIFVTLSMLLSFSILLSACAAQPTAPVSPEVVKETVVVEVTKQVEVLVTPKQEPAGPVTISFWHGYNADPETPFLENTIIPAFEASHPDIKSGIRKHSLRPVSSEITNRYCRWYSPGPGTSGHHLGTGVW